MRSTSHSQGPRQVHRHRRARDARDPVEYARSRNRLKRGGERARPVERPPGSWVPISGVGKISIALSTARGADPRQAKVVELRYFGGMTVEEAAEVLDVSAKTVKRDWSIARAWLRRELGA